MCCGALQCVAMCCSVLWDLFAEIQLDLRSQYCGAVCCNVLQCVAVCCSVLQCVMIETQSDDRDVMNDTLF